MTIVVNLLGKRAGLSFDPPSVRGILRPVYILKSTDINFQKIEYFYLPTGLATHYPQ